MIHDMHADRIEIQPEPEELERCDELDIYEQAIVLKQKLLLTTSESSKGMVVLPVDLETRDGTEFLHYELNGEVSSIDINNIEAVEQVVD